MTVPEHCLNTAVRLNTGRYFRTRTRQIVKYLSAAEVMSTASRALAKRRLVMVSKVAGTRSSRGF